MYGKRIRQLRKEKKLTLKDLSSALGIPVTTLGNYEREDREPNLETLQAIANYFNVNIDYFFKGQDSTEMLVKGAAHNIEDLLNKANFEFQDIASRIFERIHFIINDELNTQNQLVLKHLQEIIDFIFDIKDEFENIHEIPKMPKEITAGSITNPYHMATNFIKRKNRIDNCINEIFEEYARRNGF